MPPPKIILCHIVILHLEKHFPYLQTTENSCEVGEQTPVVQTETSHCKDRATPTVCSIFKIASWKRNPDTFQEQLLASQLFQNFSEFSVTSISLPCSQPATCPHPQPEESTRSLPTHFFKIPYNAVLPSILASFKWSLFFFKASTTK